MAEIDALGERELDIMAALWARGTATVGDIQADLAAAGIEIAYTTVQTLLARMDAKGAVTRDVSDRAHLYRARLKRETMLKKAVERVAGRYFEGSAAGLAVRLIESDLSAEELDRIAALIDRHRRSRA